MAKSKNLTKEYIKGAKQARKIKITGWKSLWHNLNWGPRGALIAFILSTLFVVVPLIPQFILSILFIFVFTVLGALAGSLLGWLIKKLNN